MLVASRYVVASDAVTDVGNGQAFRIVMSTRSQDVLVEPDSQWAMVERGCIASLP